MDTRNALLICMVVTTCLARWYPGLAAGELNTGGSGDHDTQASIERIDKFLNSDQDNSDGMPSFFNNHRQLNPSYFHKRVSCAGDNSATPVVRVNTTSRLAALRQWMFDSNVNAFLLTRRFAFSGNSMPGNQLEFISGFGGSNGFAVVTKDKAVLWTDGRYEVEADETIDCNWALIVNDNTDLAIAFLKDELSVDMVLGVNPSLISSKDYSIYKKGLKSSMITVTSVPDDPFNKIWVEGRPPMVNEDIYVHPLEFAGETYVSKLQRLQDYMLSKKIDVQVITSLSEIAWLYNLRGSDSKNSPLFFSYSLVGKDYARIYVNKFEKMNTYQEVLDHLTNDEFPVQIKGMHEFLFDLEKDASRDKVMSISSNTNQQIFHAAGIMKIVEDSHVELMKSLKNEVEQKRYRECQIRDSSALVQFVSKLEADMDEGKVISEMSVSRDLKKLRSTYQYNRGTSFDTIAGVGSNGAIIHYTPSNLTDRQLTEHETFLLDSGGQYLDGTTDVTRTFHYGTPKQEVIDAYTRVLVGVIQLASSVWPYGTTGRVMDTMARSAMWKYGMDYRHGTGHGIGYFTTVHEGPSKIAETKRSENAPLEIGTFLSDEPGYYLRDKFAVRLESIVMVTKANTKYNFGGHNYLGFEVLTLVPFETKLIDLKQLNAQQRRWLNDYNRVCRKEISKFLKSKQDISEDDLEIALDWIESRTKYIPDNPNWDGGDAEKLEVQPMRVQDNTRTSSSPLPSSVSSMLLALTFSCAFFLFRI